MQKKELIKKLEQLKIPVDSIITVISVKFEEKLRSFEDMTNKLNEKQLMEVYLSYKYAGKVTINLCYVSGLKDVPLSTAIQKIENIYKKMINSGDVKKLVLLETEIIKRCGFLHFRNDTPTVTILNEEKNILEEYIMPDFITIVIAEKSPVVQIRTTHPNSLNQSFKILGYFATDKQSMDLNFSFHSFRSNLMAIFKKITSISMEKSPQPRRVSRIRFSDEEDIRKTKEYKEQKEEGAIETFIYAHYHGEDVIRLQINFQSNKLIFSRFTSEELIKEILTKIMEVAEGAKLFNGKRVLQDFLSNS